MSVHQKITGEEQASSPKVTALAALAAKPVPLMLRNPAMRPVVKRATLTPAERDALQDAIEKAPPGRVQRLEVNASSYWLKRQEKLSLRWRLQKGDPAQAFERERRGLHILHQLGLPVPPIVAEGEDYFVVPDHGRALSEICAAVNATPETRKRALLAGVQALRRLHIAGQAHGRPELRDMLWNGHEVTLIDFERFGKSRRLRATQITDLIILAKSCFAQSSLSVAEIEAVLAAYEAQDTAGIYPSALRWLRRLARLRPILKWVVKRKPKRDLLAALRLLDWAKTKA